MRSSETKADVLIMSTLDGDGAYVVSRLRSARRAHSFKGIWATGVSWGGGSCYGSYGDCVYVAGATQQYRQEFQDPLFGSSGNFSSMVKVHDAMSSDGGAKTDVGAIISSYAQAFQRAYHFRRISDKANFIDNKEEYEYYRHGSRLEYGI
jgi:hypothetical protein